MVEPISRSLTRIFPLCINCGKVNAARTIRIGVRSFLRCLTTKTIMFDFEI